MNSLKRRGNVLKGLYDRHPKIIGVAATAIASAGIVFGAGGICAAVQPNQEGANYWCGVGLAAISISLITGILTAAWYRETEGQRANGITNKRRECSNE
jgi:formate hydrogenlyase subunit 3/multisubunit Na+/H+ antiporter MnhD subunit